MFLVITFIRYGLMIFGVAAAILLFIIPSIGAWIWLGGAIRRTGGTRGDAARAGALTGLVEPVAATLHLALLNPSGDELWLGWLVTPFYAVFWSLVGALVCGAAARGPRVR